MQAHCWWIPLEESNRQFTCLLWGLFPGLISQVHALSSEAVSHNDTGAWAVKRTDLGLKSYQKENMQPLKVEFFTHDWQKHNNLLDRAPFHPDKPSVAHLIQNEFGVVSFAPAAPGSDGGARARLRANVKRGDFLRTLGGAMTAQCKVLHLLLSQSDTWASCHSECVTVSVVLSTWELRRPAVARLLGPGTRSQARPRRGVLLRSLFLARRPDRYVYAFLAK